MENITTEPTKTVSHITEPSDEHAAELLTYTKDITPQQAANTITRAKAADMNPAEYAVSKDALDPVYDVHNRTPAEVEPVVKQYMSDNIHNAALVKDDLSNLNDVVKNVKNVSFNSGERRETLKLIDELEAKKVKYGFLPDNEKEILEYSYERVGLATPEEETFFGGVGSFVSQLVKDVGEGAKKGLEPERKQFKAMYFQAKGKRQLENARRELLDEQFKHGQLVPYKQELLDNISKELQIQTDSLGLTTVQQIPSLAVGSTFDMLYALGENPGLALVGGAGGALVGGALGYRRLGPVGVVPGVWSGTKKGISLAAGALISADMYHRIAGESYNDIKAMNLGLDVTTQKNIARGVALGNAVAEAFTSKALIGGFGKLVSKKVLTGLVKDTGFRAATDILGHALKTAGVSGAEEFSGALIEIVGKHYAKSLAKINSAKFDLDTFVEDKLAGRAPAPVAEVFSMEALIEAMNNTANDIATKPEVRKQLFVEAATGVFAGFSIASVSGGAGYSKVKKSYDTRNQEIIADKQEIKENQKRMKIAEDAMDILAHRKSVVDMSEASRNAETKNLAPDELSKIRRLALEESGNTAPIYFTEADILTIAEKNPEVAAKIRENNMTEMSAASAGTVNMIEPHVFLDLVDDAPTVLDYYKLNPESVNPLDGEVILKKLDDLNLRREKIFEGTAPGEKLNPEQERQMLKIEEEVRQLGKEDYLTDPELDKAIDKIMPETKDEAKKKTEFDALEDKGKKTRPESRADKYKKAQLQAREAVTVQILLETEAQQMRANQTVLKAFDTVEKQKLDIEHAHAVETLELLKPVKEAGIPVPIATHKKKGFSKYAVDPKFIIDETLRKAYVTDPKLNKAKMFVEGGITPDESAAQLGYESGEQMFKILANTPTKKEMLSARTKKINENRKLQESYSPEALEARREVVLNNRAKLLKMGMDYMMKYEQPATKQGIKTIVYKARPLAELKLKAIRSIKDTKVKNLNPRQFNASVKSESKMATDLILDNDVVKAVQAQENALFNNELTRESLKTQVKVDKARANIKKITSKKGMRILKDSGMDIYVNEIMELFNMNDSKGPGKTARQEGYFDYTRRLESEGRNLPEVPKQFADLRQRGADMTTEKFLQVSEWMQTVYHQAKKKNTFLKNLAVREKNKKTQDLKAVTYDAAKDLIENHPDYTAPKKELRGRAPTTVELVKEGLTDSLNKLKQYPVMMTNFKNIVTELDQEKLGGKHYDLLAMPMVNSETFKRNKIAYVMEHTKKIAADYGEKEFHAAFNYDTKDPGFNYVPEFEGFIGLGSNEGIDSGDLGYNGVLTKADMWTLLSYLGDPQGRERIGNFVHKISGEPIDIETVRTALESKLTEKDAKLVQNFTNIFKSFEEEASALHERTTGVKPNMVKGVAFEFHGKMWEGGYTPLNYKNLSANEKIDRFLDSQGEKELGMFGGKDDKGRLYARLRSAEQTEQGRLMDRVGSSKPLDLNFMNFLNAYEEHIHDLAYRESGADTLKLLRNEEYKAAIINTVGLAKYNTLVDGVIETVGKTLDNDTGVFSEDHRRIDKFFNWLEKGFVVKVLGFNPTSVAKQPLSIGAAIQRMGANGSKYILASSHQMLKAMDTPAHYKKFFDEAVDINSDLGKDRDNVDDSMNTTTLGWIEETRKYKASKTLKTIANASNKMVEASLWGIKNSDVHIKAMVTRGAYMQFMDGQVEGYPQSRLDKMTNIERISRAKQYAKQVADLSLTTSATIDKNALQKNSITKYFTKFYNDVRAQHLTGLAEARKIKYAVKKGRKARKAGEMDMAIKQRNYALRKAGNLMVVWSLMKIYNDSFSSGDSPLDELKRVDNIEDLGRFALNAGSSFITAPLTGLAESAPLVRDYMYLQESKWRYKGFSLPMTQAISDYMVGIGGLADAIGGAGMSKQQWKAFKSASAMTLRAPYNGPKKLAGYVQNMYEVGVNGAAFAIDSVDRLFHNSDVFIELHKDDPKMKKEVEEVKQIQREMLPPEKRSPETLIPENTMETLKLNKWDDLDLTTGGAGIYQFTEAQWDQIIEEAPGLGLTDDGRTSKDTAQQEMAMMWELEKNAKALAVFQIPTTIENLYGAHRFGVEDYAMILSSKDNEKLSDIVENTQLFEGLTIVKHVKKYVKKRIKN